jgi:hypothetical protein
MVCPFAIGKAFGLADATWRYETPSRSRYTASLVVDEDAFHDAWFGDSSYATVNMRICRVSGVTFADSPIRMGQTQMIFS